VAKHNHKNCSPYNEPSQNSSSLEPGFLEFKIILLFV